MYSLTVYHKSRALLQAPSQQMALIFGCLGIFNSFFLHYFIPSYKNLFSMLKDVLYPLSSHLGRCCASSLAQMK